MAAWLCVQALAGKQIFYYSSTHSHKRTNAAFLISAYAMLYLGRSPEEAYRPFHGIYPPFPPFHDASPCVCTYNLTILDCLRGLYRARACKFFNFDRFDIDEYEYYEKVRMCVERGWGWGPVCGGERPGATLSRRPSMRTLDAARWRTVT